MISKAVTGMLLVLITPAMFARGQGKHIPPAPPGPSEYEVYFRSLTPEEQVIDLVTRFSSHERQMNPCESAYRPALKKRAPAASIPPSHCES